jgi:hypothetical protein
MISRACIVCGEPLQTENPRAIFCPSKSCKMKAFRRRHRGETCRVCNRPLTRGAQQLRTCEPCRKKEKEAASADAPARPGSGSGIKVFAEPGRGDKPKTSSTLSTPTKPSPRQPFEKRKTKLSSTICARPGCSEFVPQTARDHSDNFCSRECFSASSAHGVPA